MKTQSLVLFACLFVAGSRPCSAQVLPQTNPAQPSLVPSGNTTLPPGQYIMTNLNTGQAVYVVVGQGGQMLAQDTRILQITAQPMGNPSGLLQQQQPQQGSGWGGMLKQGLETILQNRTAPDGQPGTNPQ